MEKTNGTSEEQIENPCSQSQSKRIFDDKNEKNQSEGNAPWQSEISASQLKLSTAIGLKVCLKKKEIIQIKSGSYFRGPGNFLPLRRDTGYYGNYIEVEKNLETRRLVEQRSTSLRPGTLRWRYDPHSKRTTFAPSRPDKYSREEKAG